MEGSDEERVVKYSVEKGVALVVMDRPGIKNAFHNPMYTQLTHALKKATEDESVVAVIITGSGSYFSSGADLKNSIPIHPSCDAPVGRFMQAVLKFPKLLVAAVNGPAVGIGTTLLPHCDMVYASEDAFFWTPFARIAVVPEFCSSVTFPAIMGPSLASEMVMFGRKLTADRALMCGLVSDIFPKDKVLEEAQTRVRAFLDVAVADRTAPLFKAMLRESTRQQYLDVCLKELAELDRRFECGDTLEAVMALSSKPSNPRAKL